MIDGFFVRGEFLHAADIAGPDGGVGFSLRIGDGCWSFDIVWTFADFFMGFGFFKGVEDCFLTHVTCPFSHGWFHSRLCWKLRVKGEGGKPKLLVTQSMRLERGNVKSLYTHYLVLFVEPFNEIKLGPLQLSSMGNGRHLHWTRRYSLAIGERCRRCQTATICVIVERVR